MRCCILCGLHCLCGFGSSTLFSLGGFDSSTLFSLGSLFCRLNRIKAGLACGRHRRIVSSRCFSLQFTACQTGSLAGFGNLTGISRDSAERGFHHCGLFHHCVLHALANLNQNSQAVHHSIHRITKHDLRLTLCQHSVRVTLTGTQAVNRQSHGLLCRHRHQFESLVADVHHEHVFQFDGVRDFTKHGCQRSCNILLDELAAGQRLATQRGTKHVPTVSAFHQSGGNNQSFSLFGSGSRGGSLLNQTRQRQVSRGVFGDCSHGSAPSVRPAVRCRDWFVRSVLPVLHASLRLSSTFLLDLLPVVAFRSVKPVSHTCFCLSRTFLLLLRCCRCCLNQ